MTTGNPDNACVPVGDCSKFKGFYENFVRFVFNVKYGENVYKFIQLAISELPINLCFKVRPSAKPFI